jgi:DNA-binding response OmpR family regulator
MVTGFPTEENRAECMKLGADGYMTKPINLPELITLLRDLMPAGKPPS